MRVFDEYEEKEIDESFEDMHGAAVDRAYDEWKDDELKRALEEERC